MRIFYYNTEEDEFVGMSIECKNEYELNQCRILEEYIEEYGIDYINRIVKNNEMYLSKKGLV